MCDFDASGASIDVDGAAIDAVLNDFHARDGAGLQKAEHGIPVIGWAITQPEFYAICPVCRSRGSLSSQGARRAVKEFSKGFVEATYAAESSSQGNLRHGHAGFVNELLRKE